METITLQNSKALHAICKEKGVIMRESVKSHTKGRNFKITLLSDSTYNIKKTIPAIKGGVWSDYVGDGFWSYKQYPAYTTNELLDWLPVYIDLPNGRYDARLYFSKFDDGYTAYYQIGCAEWDLPSKAPTPQDALCLLLIELIKKGITICKP